MVRENSRRVLERPSMLVLKGFQRQFSKRTSKKISLYAVTAQSFRRPKTNKKIRSFFKLIKQLKL